jgi:Icc-related predicted phosphoesterase
MIIHCGDFTSMGYDHQISDFSKWFAGLNYQYKILICGNHELGFEKDFYYCKSLLDSSITLLHDDAVEIEGIKIFGSAKTPPFMRWAFMFQEEMLDYYFGYIPYGTDIIVTHCPPYGILDLTMDGEHVGSRALLKHTQRVKPKLNCFGHIHLGGGLMKQIDGTTYINASVCTEEYKPENSIMTFDVEDK